uniref:hypothetical protein n=1 Tax=Salmonella sp. s51933 TaxID=3160127 RepID=UPI0037545FAC
ARVTMLEIAAVAAAATPEVATKIPVIVVARLATLLVTALRPQTSAITVTKQAMWQGNVLSPRTTNQPATNVVKRGIMLVSVQLNSVVM